MEMSPYSYFQWCRYFWCPWVSFVMMMSSQWGSKNYFKDLYLMNSQPTFPFLTFFLTQRIMAILSKECKLDNFKPHNFLKLSFTKNWGLHSNFVEHESFLESNSLDILALCETKLDDSTDFDNFSVKCYLSLIRKDSITHMLLDLFLSSDKHLFYNGFPSTGKFCCCCLSFHWHSNRLRTGCPVSSHSLWLILMLIEMVFMIIWDGLRQLLATESPLKMMKNAFHFILKALFVLKIFKFLAWDFGYV